MPTPGELARATVERLYDKLLNRRRSIVRLESYFAGEQRLAFASDQWRAIHENRYKGFADNWCGVVGRAAPERTELLGVRIGDDSDVLSSNEKLLMRDWLVNDGEAQSAQGFLSTAITGRSFVTVWGDENDEPSMRWEHAAQTIVEYSDLGRATAALKAWTHDGTEYATLYTPEAVWKWQLETDMTDDGREVPVWVERLPFITGDDVWPIPNPLGVVPVVEFQNRPVLGKGPVSDIDGSIAMQDAVNLMWAYLFGAADYASMPGRVVMGAERPKMPLLDATGKVIGEQDLPMDKLADARVLFLTGENAKIGQWDAAKLDVFTSALHVMVKHLASQTRTPIHYIMGELGNVNGETLTATELPLAYKVREGHKHLSRPIREVFRLLALVRGNESLAEQCRTARLAWANPETATDAQQADAALKDVQIGFPFEVVLERRYGMSPTQIADVLAKRDKEATDPYVMAKLEGQQSDNSAAPEGGDEVPDEPAA